MRALGLLALALALAGAGGDTAAAASPPAAATSAGASPCPATLEFAGLLFLDSDRAVPAAEAGPVVGYTEPDPARCGLPPGLPVHRHGSNLTTAQVLRPLPGGGYELFQSAGSGGFPGQGLLRLAVLLLVVFVLLFAALPALVTHLRRPPIEV